MFCFGKVLEYIYMFKKINLCRDFFDFGKFKWNVIFNYNIFKSSFRIDFNFFMIYIFVGKKFLCNFLYKDFEWVLSVNLLRLIDYVFEMNRLKVIF